MTDCIRCGDCCDPITLNAESLARMLAWGDPNLPHPFVNPTHWTEGDGWEFWRAVNAWPRNRVDGAFIREHWTVVWSEGDKRALECDFFDATARMCFAGPERPPICSDYPWYGHGPDPEQGKRLPERCSFRADITEVAVTLT